MRLLLASSLKRSTVVPTASAGATSRRGSSAKTWHTGGTPSYRSPELARLFARMQLSSCQAMSTRALTSARPPQCQTMYVAPAVQSMLMNIKA